MAPTYVALDLETTGLDPETDAIIEVGAVRFDGDGVLGRFQSLVDPRRRIPLPIQVLTGISDSDVSGAPLWSAVAPELEAFLDGSIIVGHNVLGFDTLFLEAAGIRHGEVIYDTQELASLLAPGLSEYGLAALSAEFGIPLSEHHRAPADAEAARLLFLALQERATALPPIVLAQVAQWLTPTAWPWRDFFRQSWEMASARGSAQEPQRRKLPALPEPLTPPIRRRAVAEEEALAVLRAARGRPDVFPEFDERLEQQAMVGAVMKALNEEQRLIVEAGTGTGKSLAYLIPAACHALANGDRVVVSTATINLQEQLTKKDIPTVAALLGRAAGAGSQDQGAGSKEHGTRGLIDGELRSCQLKGRRNYLCMKRFEALRTSPGLSDEEALLASRVLIWLGQTESGDRAELRLSQAEETVWRGLSADGADCTASNSPYVVEGSCFLQRARRAAEGSHVVVVNHSLLLSDITAGGTVLPPYERLVIDEAHHLEEEATRQFGFSSGERETSELLERCNTLAKHADAGMRDLSPGGRPELAAGIRELRQVAATASVRVSDFYGELAAFLRQQYEGLERDQRLSLNRSMRVQPDWAGVEIAWENLRLTMSDLISVLRRVQLALGVNGAAQMANCELIRAETEALLQDGQELVAGLSAAIEVDDPLRIVWLECERSDGSIVVSSAPLVVSDLLRERLYADRSSIVLTGATLRSEGGLSILRPSSGQAPLATGFEYIQERLGLEDAGTLALGSPFDYRRAALVLVPVDMPEPNHAEYAESLARGVIDLARAAGGRMLALFTSHASLRTTHGLVSEALSREGISVLGQGIDGSARQLVRALQSSPRTVLLGTASFWEGVDIVGEALSLLIMTRLPFNVPTEPVFAARSALYDDPFNQYALPQAILRFKQGFGRLIRSKTDRGVMVVLDGRITSKSYGTAFLGSLPGCSMREAALREMPDLVERWLGQQLAVSC